MKKTLTSALIGVMVMSTGTALAGHGHNRFYDKARVIDVEPIYTTVRVSVPHEECYQQEVRTPVHNHHSDGTAIVGGIIGGIIGHKIGKGKGGATVAGTLVGAAVGKSAGRHKDRYHEEVRYEDHCTTHVSYRKEERLEGYHVTYRYRGEEFTTRMNNHPGKFVRLKVRVSPVVE